MDNIIIEKAGTSDAREVMRLISLADKDAVISLSGGKNINDALRIYEKNFSRHDVYFSYKNVFIARDNSQIVGCILYFKGEDEPRFASLTDHAAEFPNESSPDEVYIDSLAVACESQGKGIASALIQRVIDETISLGLHKVGLLADIKKSHLKNMYKKMGFNVAGELELLGDRYEKMIYNITL